MPIPSEDVSDILEEVREIFRDNLEGVYVVGSYMMHCLAGMGLAPKPDHPPRDIDLLVRVRDVERAMEQYGRHRVCGRLHMGFNDKLCMEGITHLKIYPEIAVNNCGKASMGAALRLLGGFISKRPSILIRQAWSLRRSLKKCVENLRYPFFNL